MKVIILQILECYAVKVGCCSGFDRLLMSIERFGGVLHRCGG